MDTFDAFCESIIKSIDKNLLKEYNRYRVYDDNVKQSRLPLINKPFRLKKASTNNFIMRPGKEEYIINKLRKITNQLSETNDNSGKPLGPFNEDGTILNKKALARILYNEFITAFAERRGMEGENYISIEEIIKHSIGYEKLGGRRVQHISTKKMDIDIHQAYNTVVKFLKEYMLWNTYIRYGVPKSTLKDAIKRWGIEKGQQLKDLAIRSVKQIPDALNQDSVTM